MLTSNLVPAQIAAGDSVTWARTFDGYSSLDGWSLKYTAVSATAAFNFTATGQPDGSFVASIDGSTTGAWVAGSYQLAEYVDNGSQRVTLNRSALCITPNIAGVTAGIDTRTHARRMLDLIEAFFEKKLPGQQLVMLDGLRIEQYPLPDLLALRDRYRIEVQREDQLASGRPSAKLLTRF